jgi:hypothetical protein
VKFVVYQRVQFIERSLIAAAPLKKELRNLVMLLGRGFLHANKPKRDEKRRRPKFNIFPPKRWWGSVEMGSSKLGGCYEEED